MDRAREPERTDRSQPETPRFGRLLREYRSAAGLTQDALAEHAGLSVRGIADLERGARRSPYAETVERLAKALALTSDEHANLAAAARRPSAPEVAPRAPNQTRRLGATGPHNLPPQATSLIGREQAVQDLLDTLQQPQVRLLTLYGPGGVGKTRLAVAVAERLRDAFQDGAWFVDLSPVHEATLVARSITHALGVREVGRGPAQEQLQAYLRQRHLLLVLDNCERVLDYAPRVAELLAACEDIKILATSREPLRVRWEHLYPVPPLLVPQNVEPLEPEMLGQVSAVALFVERGRRADPVFTLNRENAVAVTQLCARLDGLPLAIELAAAGIRVFPPALLLEQLSHWLRASTGPRDAPDRHQSLSAAIAWSYELLSEDEQAVFQAVSLFPGGCTFEAGGAVIGEPRGAAVLTAFASLIDKSLLRLEPAVPNGEARYRVLDTVRAFALERLEASGEPGAVWKRYADYFVELAEQAELQLRGPVQGVWLDRLDREYDNLQTALRWSLDGDQSSLGIRLATALGLFWWMRGHIAEGRRWLLAALAAEVEPLDRLKVLQRLGWLALLLGDYAEATNRLDESLVLAHQLGEEQRVAETLTSLGVLARNQGDYVRAIALYEQSLAQWRRLDDRRGRATTLNNLGIALRSHGDCRRARAVHLKSLQLYRDLGDQNGVGHALANLGDVALEQHQYALASRLLHESLALRRQIGDVRGVAISVGSLGRVARKQRDFETAESLHTESLQLARKLGLTWFVAAGLEGLASVAVMTGRPGRAARLLGAAATIRRDMGSVAAPADQADVDRTAALARAALGEPVFARAWAEGQTLTPGVVADEARDSQPCEPQSSNGSRPAIYAPARGAVARRARPKSMEIRPNSS